MVLCSTIESASASWSIRAGRGFMPIWAWRTCSGDAGSMPQLKPSTPLGSWPATARFQARMAHHRLAGVARKEDQQRDRPARRAEHCPVRRAGALKARVDDVLRPVRLVGLRNEAAALGELVRRWWRECGKRADGQMADQVWGRSAIDGDLAGLDSGCAAAASASAQPVATWHRPRSGADQRKSVYPILAPSFRRKGGIARSPRSSFHSPLIPQRLARLQRERDALLRLALAAERQKRLALKV